MNKRIIALFLSLLVLAGLALPAHAEKSDSSQTKRVRIVNVKNLEKLAENCRLDSYSQDLVVSLEADLDLENSDFTGIPIFCGVFEGNGHTIRGLNLTHEGSAQGFFRYLSESAQVCDLHLMGTVQPVGTSGEVGGFVGENRGLIRGCSFTGTVSGKEYIGGIAGSNLVSGTIESCNLFGTVYGNHFVGGIAGKNAGVIRSCENNAQINGTPQQNTVKLEDISMRSVIESESANTLTDVGGIAGTSTGLIRGCVNNAKIGHTSMGYNIGGIAGTQSGTIAECENHGEIYGRKEVGGIAGQMEPSSVMKFEEDVVQILTRQLEGMGKIVSQASSNLEGVGESIVGQLGSMYDYVEGAKDAARSLIPTNENPGFLDFDTVQAAQNNIGSSLVGMSKTIDGIGAMAYGALGAVSTDLHAMNNQINVMRSTIGNVSETLGGSIVDKSDEDSELDFAGKVLDCWNYGNIHADLNGGGIVGAIAMENDLDLKEDWSVTGRNSLNFESEIRAVVLRCENTATVTVEKQNAGGIVGFQSLGLVRDSHNFGLLAASEADHVGGISGRSKGFIRSCHANGSILGSSYVGGIAGSAAIATDCYALVKIEKAVEKVGAILGFPEENETEEEDPVTGNYYLAVPKDLGAIDGISYDGQAQAVEEDEFFQLEDLPERFRRVHVFFRYGNGSIREFSVEYGSDFPAEWIPPIPPKDGRQSYWKGLAEVDLSGIQFDMVFEQDYTTQITVLESSVTRNELPQMLVQGIFSEDASLVVEREETDILLETGETLLESWKFRTTEPDRQSQIRIQLPEGADEKNLRILIRGADHSWREETHHVLGRYVVANLVSGDEAVAIIRTGGVSWLLLLGIAGVVVLTGILLYRNRKRR